ncbi:uncharacterized protein LOC108603652 isoform X2 [Drosophila busckii]|uniref:uncharacterized protein LOC108603652 isoform X2 n=1 Tax=Drosophila busckii TaxID=30019 RepID=UPI00083EC529|nr:uncharacterized protein LOC108603652 isoform X2 [Drosophila busckii]
MPPVLHISRCLRYHAPLCRASRLLHGSYRQWRRLSNWQPLQPPRSSSMLMRVQLYSQRNANVFTFNGNAMLRKRVSFTTSLEDTKQTVVPVGVITPETKDGKELKIIIVPLDLANQDAEALKHTLESINQLRKYASEIEAFTNSMTEDFSSKDAAAVSEEKQLGNALMPEVEGMNFWESYAISRVKAPAAEPLEAAAATATAVATEATPTMPTTPNPGSPNTPYVPLQTPLQPNVIPTTTPPLQPSTMPFGDPMVPQINATAVVSKSLNDADMEQIIIDVPKSLGEQLNDMAISSMQLSFEMDMTNVRDVILHGESAQVREAPSLCDDPMVCLETKVEVDSAHEITNTLPIRFNALIKGTVEIDANKLNPEQLSEEHLPEYNDTVTSIAANICSTALQRGFPTDLNETTATTATAPESAAAETLAAEAIASYNKAKLTAEKRIAMKRHQAEMASQKLQWITPEFEVREMGTLSLPQEVEVPYLKDGCKYPIIKPKKKCPKKCPLDDPCKENPCKRPKKPQKPKKAASTTEITAMADKKDTCGKGKDAKGKDGKDKKDPCAKFKKGKDGKDGKKDPCAKGKDGKDGKAKKDPCAKFKKGKDGKGKKDPCAKKDAKKDPCAKKDAKKDPCAKGKDGKDGKAKKDPCAKFKKGKDGKGKKDPCAKKDAKKDPCAKKDAKKDPCKKKFSTYPVSKFYTSNGATSRRSLSTSLSSGFVDLKLENQKSHLSYNLKPRFMGYSSLARCLINKQRSSPARFPVYSTLVRRHYGGLRSKQAGVKQPCPEFSMAKYYSKGPGKSEDGKCSVLTTKMPANRKETKKRADGLRTDCFGLDEECPKNRCTGNCGPIKKPVKKCDRSKQNKGKERNELLNRSSLMLSQMRMQSDLSLSRKRYMSLISEKTATVSEPLDSVERDTACTPIEVVRIPTSYKISKHWMPRPVVKQFDVLIRTGSVALTGSDIHVYENANRELDSMTLGHDATGFVEEIGSCVHHLRVGDRVVMESALSCGICEFCKQGLYNICSDLVYNGFMGSHQSHPADLCHRLPDDISMEVGTLTQTLALGCQACFKANITPTSNVLIIGSSPTAVSAAMCATAIGAKRVAIASNMNASLDTIKQDFNFNTISFDANALFGEVLESIYTQFKDWPNCVINCAITPMTMNLAVMALQPCSVCILAECETECASFNALDVLMKNIRLIPSFRSANMYPTALQLMKSGRAPMHKFIARAFPWSELEDAFRCAQHESNVGLRKVIVNNCVQNDIGGLIKNKFQKSLREQNE